MYCHTISDIEIFKWTQNSKHGTCYSLFNDIFIFTLQPMTK